MLLVGVMIMTLTACGGKKTVKYDDSSLESILSSMDEDFNVTTEYLETELDKVLEKMGKTYEEFIKNQDKLTAWYTLVEAETKALFERSESRCNDFFELMRETIDMDDYDSVVKTLEDYYDVVISDCMSEYNDDVICGLLDEIEEEIIDELSDAYFDGDIREKDYDLFEEAHNKVYESLLAKFETLGESLESQIEKIDKELEGDSTNDAKDDEEESISDVDWKTFLDDYEDWVDEYIDIYEQYKEDPTDMDVLTEYTELVAEMTEWATDAEELKLEITDTDEALEYATELTRIAAKLADVTY